MTNPTQHPACCSEARKRRDEAHAATGATNSPNMTPSATEPENGALDVEVIRRSLASGFCLCTSSAGTAWEALDALLAALDRTREALRLSEGEREDLDTGAGMLLGENVELRAELDAASATIKRVEAQAATWESNAIDGADLYCAHKVRAALASPDAGDER